MKAATMARMFEPFYTTKDLGQGTGLGLSIVYGILKQAAGHIRVYSGSGTGTRFEVLFPRAYEPEDFPDPTPVTVAAIIGSETILVVEDDEGVRQLVSAVLKRGGYEVLLAHEGNEALRICAEHESKVGLILTDLVMPGMSGPALLKSLRNIDPGIRVLCMSGYSSDALAGHGTPDPRIPFIHKPFTAPDLILKIREVLKSDAGHSTTMDAST
jgi:CheY-like chemotaxis protein